MESPERYVGLDVPCRVGGRVVMSQRYKALFPVTPGGTNVHIGRIFYEPQTDCSGGGEGVIEEVWDDGAWCRVRWDKTDETGCYWIASMWTCLPHATGGHDRGQIGCSPLASLDPPDPSPRPAPPNDGDDGAENDGGAED
uniref:Uncharacterized protein n=1 Tax=Cryptomonas curvata TaxID=233186 RepID=A0A7S0QVA1_9CRYP|mmetsp:Transcript_57701/g.120645  ORF Transcript_57701/g.120645 Transcript_57701/m.120645 type:complete len:140 (+) Transcript_57701:28-447(+)